MISNNNITYFLNISGTNFSTTTDNVFTSGFTFSNLGGATNIKKADQNLYLNPGNSSMSVSGTAGNNWTSANNNGNYTFSYRGTGLFAQTYYLKLYNNAFAFRTGSKNRRDDIYVKRRENEVL